MMTSGVTQATLDDRASVSTSPAQLPTTHANVDRAALTDDIALLAHHLTCASGSAERPGPAAAPGTPLRAQRPSSAVALSRTPR